MATITLGGSGNWSSTTPNAPWPSGTLPTSADDVVVPKNLTLTLDTTTAVARTLTLNVGTTTGDVGGIFTCSTTANSKLVLERGCTANGSTGASGAYSSFVNLDMSGAPSYTCEIRGNNERLAGGYFFLCSGDYVFKGATRKRWTRLNGGISAGATTAIVDDASGWRIGDVLVMMSTGSHSRPAKTDTVTLTTVNTSTGEIGWSGGTTYAHADNCPVGNFTSNLIFRPAVNQDVFMLGLVSPGTQMARSGYCDHVAFIESGSTESYQQGMVTIQGTSSKLSSLSNNAFLNISRKCIGGGGAIPSFTKDYNIFYTNINVSTYQAFAMEACTKPIGPCRYWAVFDNQSTVSSGVIRATYADNHQIGHVCGGGQGQYGVAPFISNGLPSVRIEGCEAWSTGGAVATIGDVFDCKFGSSVFSGCDNGSYDLVTFAASSYITNVINSYFPSSIKLSGLGADSPGAVFNIINKNLDPLIQESYGTHSNTVPEVARNSSVMKSSTSSLEFTCSATTPIARSFQVLAKSGETIKILCYVRKNSTYGSSTLPFITVSGLGITPVTSTMSSSTAADTWELLELNATNTASADGNLTVTLTAQSSTSGAKAYFSGLPASPFITRCRHYGYLFDETIPTRTVNPVVVASESAALAYTGVTIDSSTPKITVASGTANTFQKVYDYIQAWACANVDKTVLLTSTDGINFNVPLTCKVDWAAMSNDGTLAGGWLLLVEGTYNLRLSGTKIDFTEAGTYNMSGTVFSGTVELVNSSGGSVTVSVPAGISYTNTGPNITVTEPVEGYGLAFSGLLSGSTVKVFETGTTTVIDSVASSETTWQWDTTGAGETVDYTILKDGYTPIRIEGVALTDSVVPVSVQQTLERAYVTSSGLTFGTNTGADPSTKKLDASTASTIQNYYSHMLESWRTESGLANAAFPIVPNGPNSFSLIDGWEFTETSLPYLSRDGLRYVSTGGTQTAVWAAVLSVGTSAGMRVRYQQSDGGTTGEAATTGPIDELIQIYGDSTHGNFDYRSYLKLKVQADGYDEATADAITTYGNLEDQLYIVGLAPLSNGLATGDPSVTGVTITDHGASPVTWNSKSWSITITDNGTHSGTDIMRWLRYNFAQGGTFQGTDAFNWHDLVQVNGSKFKTIRGPIYGDTGASLKGVRVLRGTDPHPDFDLMTADDGTTYAPPPTAIVSISGGITGSRVQLYDNDSNEELLNSATPPFTWSEIYSGNREIRLRVMQADSDSATIFLDTVIGTITESSPTISYLVDQDADSVYAINGRDGSAVTGIEIDDANLLIKISSGTLTTINGQDCLVVSWKDIYAYQVYWLSTEEGIRDEGRCIEAPDPANYRCFSFAIKNVSGYPVVLIDGYGVDAATGTVAALFDVSGGSIFPAPDHVVAYSTGAEATVAIVQQGLTAQGLTTTRSGYLDRLDAAVTTRAPAADTALLTKSLRNKREVSKDGSTWKLVVFDDDDTTPILSKDLKDVNGNDIADLAAGALAQEEASDV